MYSDNWLTLADFKCSIANHVPDLELGCKTALKSMKAVCGLLAVLYMT